MTPLDTPTVQKEIIDFHGYSLISVYRSINVKLGNEIIDFWRCNNAIGDLTEAQRRVADVVYIIRAPDNSLAGISSVYIADVNPNEPYYFYRMFIQPNYRRPGMMRKVTEVTGSYLKALDLFNKPAGLVIVTENPKLMRPGMRRVITRLGYEYMGKTKQNLDLWKSDFQKSAKNAH